MAQGAAVVNITASVANGSSLDIQPSTGVEWVIHNLYWGGAVELYWTDGTNTIKFDTDSSTGGRLGTVFHCTHSTWVRIKNVSGGALSLGYDGVQTST